jgi:hypothetical protein
MEKTLKIMSRYTAIAYFFIVFILGASIYKDYGISVDEEFHRMMGFYWLKYIIDFLPNNEFSENFYQIYNNINVVGFNFNELNPQNLIYGVIFDLPICFIEVLFNVLEPNKIFHLRHMFTFLIFFISLIFFYQLLLERFNDKLALLGTTALVLSPRIFGNSFFNNKDIIFMSLFLIAIYYFYKILKKVNLKNIIYFSLFCAVATAARGIGIAIIIFFISFFILSSISNKKYFKKNIGYYMLSIFLYFLFTIILWPYLWSNPLNNFLYAIQALSNYPHEYYILYDSKIIKTVNIPWHYLFKWMFISTPFLYQILFIIGFFLVGKKLTINFLNIKDDKKLKKIDDLWTNVNEKFDINLFLLITAFLFLIIKSNSTLYTGWRHIYFLYPLMIYFSIFSVNEIIKLFKHNQKIKKLLLYTAIVYFIFISLVMYKIHPYQNLYFNNFAGKEVHRKYEVDYWGLANVKFLKQVLSLEKNNSEIINIATASWMPIVRSFNFLTPTERKKINLVGQEYQKADYIFNNFIYEVNININDKYEIPLNFEVIDDFSYKNVKIYEIYKKK